MVVGVKVLSATEKQSKSGGGGDRAEDATERREKE